TAGRTSAGRASSRSAAGGGSTSRATSPSPRAGRRRRRPARAGTDEEIDAEDPGPPGGPGSPPGTPGAGHPGESRPVRRREAPARAGASPFRAVIERGLLLRGGRLGRGRRRDEREGGLRLDRLPGDDVRDLQRERVLARAEVVADVH